MTMMMQSANVGNYELIVIRTLRVFNWKIWIRKSGTLIGKLNGCKSCTDTKLLAQQHLHRAIMTKTERKRFDPGELLDWKNALPQRAPGERAAGKPRILN